jgi:hypothetical protein
VGDVAYIAFPPLPWLVSARRVAVKERPTTGLRARRARPPMRLAGTLRDSVPHRAEQWSGPCNGHPANSLIFGVSFCLSVF